MLLSVGIFCGSLPGNFRRPIPHQSYSYDHTPVAYQKPPARAHTTVRPTCNVELITEWRQEFQTYTQAQFQARQTVGKTYGQKTGLGNQSVRLQETLKQNLEWVHKTRPGQTFVTNPSKSAKEIIDQLEKYVPNQIKNESTFYKVFHGERKGMYGWQLVDKEIRSEAEGGIGPSERSETST